MTWSLAFLILIPLLNPVRAQGLFEVEEAFPELRFILPVDLANDGSGYLYVVEKPGRIYTFPNEPSTADTTLFLDIRDRVYNDPSESEPGLLGLAFHPNYAENGYFFVYYVTEPPLRARLSRFERSESDPLTADVSSETIFIEVPKPSPRHNGGDLVFGPDGYLYVSLGDGSTGSDLFDNAQNLKTLLGSLIRIDVDHAADGKQYGIPPDNPFVGNSEGYLEEIYAYGLRNPWRFSIDPVTEHIWLGNVGERTWEEVEFIVKGGNYGWPILEGPECYRPPEDCSTDGLHPPVHYYHHDIGRSITGGFVYRGKNVPELQGKYIFADWNARTLSALTYSGENPLESGEEVQVEQIAEVSRISSFGVDEDQELYMLDLYGGKVMRFVATTKLDTTGDPSIDDFNLVLDGPNPFTERTFFNLMVNRSIRVEVVVYDALGRHVETLFDGTLPAGSTRRLDFDGSNIPAGVYFVRAQMEDGGSIIRRIALVP